MCKTSSNFSLILSDAGLVYKSNNLINICLLYNAFLLKNNKNFIFIKIMQKHVLLLNILISFWEQICLNRIREEKKREIHQFQLIGFFSFRIFIKMKTIHLSSFSHNIKNLCAFSLLCFPIIGKKKQGEDEAIIYF